jgi:hypothetical protein
MKPRTALRYRLIHDPNSQRPWIIERSRGHPHWVEIIRFTTKEEAHIYLAGITDNQHAYLESEP